MSDLVQSEPEHDHEQLKNKNQKIEANKSKSPEHALLITTNSPMQI